jgi:peptidyl-prolyl cis-trans isomerase D
MALSFLRRNRGALAIRVVLGLVVVAMTLSLVAYFVPNDWSANAGTTAQDVGSVGGLAIGAREFQRVYAMQLRQYERMARGRLDANMLRMLDLDNQIFDALVDQRLVELEARNRGLAVSDSDLARYVAAQPYFQENGQFVGADRVRTFVESQGQTMDDYKRSVRREILREKLQALLTDGITVSPAEVEEEYRRKAEEIKAEYVLVAAAPLRAQVTATDDDVQKRFAANKEAYRIPEQRVVDYVLVDAATLRSQVTVTDTDIKNSYEQRADEFTEAEQACAHHILFKVKGESSPQGHTSEEAQKLATQTLAQLRAGANFEAVAKKVSEDAGSAAQGGNLSCNPRGTMVNEFENVAFNLEPGTISDPVRTQYGFHLIRLDRLQEEKKKALADVREQVRAELLSRKSEALAESKAASIREALASGKKLAEAAAGLTVQTSGAMSQAEPIPPFDAKATAEIFALKAGETPSTPLSLRSGFAFVSLREIKEPRIPELAEVQERVKSDVLEAKAFELARTRAAEVRAKASQGGLDKAAAAMGLSRRETPGLSPRGQALGELPPGLDLDQKAFTLDVKALSEPIRVTTGYAVVRVLEKKTFDPAAFEREKAALASSMREARRGQVFQAFLAQARQRFPVEKHPEVLQRLVG